MLVRNRMTTSPVTIEPDEFLSEALRRMRSGRFHRLPVVSNGRLVGIVSERDLRAHQGYLERTKVNGIMTQNPYTADATATLESVAQIMLTRQIGGLPVVDRDQLVGIITASDVMRAFLDLIGASNGGSARIDFVLEGEEHGLTEASRIVARDRGEILGVGTYRHSLGENPVCYLRLLTEDPEKIASALRMSGFDVLGVHQIGGHLLD